MTTTIHRLKAQISEMKMIIQSQQAEIHFMDDQLDFMKGKLEELQFSKSTASHAAPLLFDIYEADDQLQCSHLSKTRDFGTDPASPALFGAPVDLGQPLQLPSDQLQCSHLSQAHASPALFDAIVQCGMGIDLAPPLLFDAITQTEICFHKGMPDCYFMVDEAGQASPVIFDGDTAAGAASTQSELLPQPQHASPLLD
eukprot:7699501-Karenia_brevis.AAC.1